LKETIQVQRDTHYSLWRENSNDKDLAVGAWEHLLLCMNFMEFLSNKGKKNDDVFFVIHATLTVAKASNLIM